MASRWQHTPQQPCCCKAHCSFVPIVLLHTDIVATSEHAQSPLPLANNGTWYEVEAPLFDNTMETTSCYHTTLAVHPACCLVGSYHIDTHCINLDVLKDIQPWKYFWLLMFCIPVLWNQPITKLQAWTKHQTTYNLSNVTKMMCQGKTIRIQLSQNVSLFSLYNLLLSVGLYADIPICMALVKISRQHEL